MKKTQSHIEEAILSSLDRKLTFLEQESLYQRRLIAHIGFLLTVIACVSVVCLVFLAWPLVLFLLGIFTGIFGLAISKLDHLLSFKAFIFLLALILLLQIVVVIIKSKSKPVGSLSSEEISRLKKIEASLAKRQDDIDRDMKLYFAKQKNREAQHSFDESINNQNASKR